jgi:hypothetical protein
MRRRNSPYADGYLPGNCRISTFCVSSTSALCDLP